MIATHTKGPWEFSCPPDECTCLMIWGADKETLIAVPNGPHWNAVIGGGDCYPSEQVAVANAHLISAAPRMADYIRLHAESDPEARAILQEAGVLS